jgi:putative inorganic carbon (HCO3(-)) transporter
LNLLLFMVAVYPFMVIPGPLPYFYGPRFFVLAVVSLVAVLLLLKGGFLFKRAEYYPLYCFLLFMIVAASLSGDPVTAWAGSHRYTGAATYLFCVILFMLASQGSKRDFIVKIMVISAAVVSATAVMQHFGVNPVPHELFRERFNSYGTLGNPNFLGTYTVFILPAAIMLYINFKQARWLVCAALIYAALLMSLTRGAWLAFGVLMIVLTVYVIGTHFAGRQSAAGKDSDFSPWNHQQPVSYFAVLILVLMIVTVLLLPTNDWLIYNRLLSIPGELESAVDLQDKAGSSRMFIWKQAVNQFASNWAFGVGPDNLRLEMPSGYVEDKAFNIFLEIAVTMGIFALLSYWLFLWSCLRGRKDFWRWLLSFMVIAYLAQGMFNIDVIMNLPLFWIVLGLLTARESRVSEPGESRPDGAVFVRSRLILTVACTAILIFIAFLLIWFFYPREGTVYVPGQGVYSGQLRGQTFHGNGRWVSETGVVYEGQFKHGLFDGYGELIYPNGARYTGCFREGYFHGEGKMVSSTGEYREGYWKKGVLIEENR